MTTNDMKRILTGYRDAKDRFDTIMRNLEEIENLITGISIDYQEERVISSPKTLDRIGDVIDQLSELRKESIKAIEECADRAEEVYRLINQLEDSRLHEVLSRRYIQGQPWEKIAREIGYDERWTYRLHEQALEELIQKSQ